MSFNTARLDMWHSEKISSQTTCLSNLCCTEGLLGVIIDLHVIFVLYYLYIILVLSTVGTVVVLALVRC